MTQHTGNLLFTGCEDGVLACWSLSSSTPLRRASFHLGHYGISAIAVTALDLVTLSKRATEFSIVGTSKRMRYCVSQSFAFTTLLLPTSKRLKKPCIRRASGLVSSITRVHEKS